MVVYWLESQQQSEFTFLSLSLFSSLLVSLALSRHFLNSSSFSLFFLSFLSLSLSISFLSKLSTASSQNASSWRKKVRKIFTPWSRAVRRTYILTVVVVVARKSTKRRRRGGYFGQMEYHSMIALRFSRRFHLEYDEKSKRATNRTRTTKEESPFLVCGAYYDARALGVSIPRKRIFERHWRILSAIRAATIREERYTQRKFD